MASRHRLIQLVKKLSTAIVAGSLFLSIATPPAYGTPQELYYQVTTTNQTQLQFIFHGPHAEEITLISSNDRRTLRISAVNAHFFLLKTAPQIAWVRSTKQIVRGAFTDLVITFETPVRASARASHDELRLTVAALLPQQGVALASASPTAQPSYILHGQAERDR